MLIKKMQLCFYCAFFGLANASELKLTSAKASGINLNYIESSVRKEDDFYQYANGAWLKSTQIPNDKASWGVFNELRDNSLIQLQQIINEAQQNKAKPAPIALLYSSFMNESQLEQLGSQPLQPLFDQVAKLQTKQQLIDLFASLNVQGINTPLTISIHQDAKDSRKMIADLNQSGLGLPDRDYYLKTNDKNFTLAKNSYQIYIKNMLTALGDKKAAQMATSILDLETQLAKLQWSKVANRDPKKTYNKYTVQQLSSNFPNFNWPEYLATAKLTNKIDYLIISQPSYLKGLDQLIKDVPLSTWQTYLRWQILNAFAADLSNTYVKLNFDFYATTLRGIPLNQPRWKRGVSLVEDELGDALGKLYVTKYFPPENKAEMEELVHNLISAYAQSIDSLDWMTTPTKVKAKQKLQTMLLKIGYPNKWRNYSKLKLSTTQLIQNILTLNEFNYQYQINKLGKPVDKNEWAMNPQTVNAYYNPELNEIVFPAAILQTPFFSMSADDAVNYGAIGAIIGHEISHAFDDQGSQYDAQGNLHDWFTPQDHKNFTRKTKALVTQYSHYSPLPGYYVNGELTLGENIADNAGLANAYKAYLIATQNKPSLVLDGFTGPQRFYLSFAQAWRAKIRPNQEIVALTTDPHSPAAIRGSATLRNQAGFYQAFKLKPTDKMFLPKDKRVNIW